MRITSVTGKITYVVGVFAFILALNVFLIARIVNPTAACRATEIRVTWGDGGTQRWRLQGHCLRGVPQEGLILGRES